MVNYGRILLSDFDTCWVAFRVTCVVVGLLFKVRMRVRVANRRVDAVS